MPLVSKDHAKQIASYALEMLNELKKYKQGNEYPLGLRIRIHTVPSIAGAIRLKKFNYHVKGNAVNLASRVESDGLPGKIQVSAETYLYLQKVFYLVVRG